MTNQKMNKVFDIRTYSFSEGECLLLDTNVWLLIHKPIPTKTAREEEAIYSEGFKAMLDAQSSLSTNVIILGEYLNVICREKWKKLYKKGKYKDFRDTPEFEAVASASVDEAHQILKACTWNLLPITLDVIKRVLSEFEDGGIDFNDALLVEDCISHRSKLVTDDGDFVYGGIEVITANRKLLGA